MKKLLPLLILLGASNVQATDILTANDGTVQNSLCVGNDCTDTESFGNFDTLRLKDFYTGIHFQDTSAADFPTNDWAITINEGLTDQFAIDDIDSGYTPFTIEAGAPSASLYIENSGYIGLGTSTPAAEIHIKDSLFALK